MNALQAGRAPLKALAVALGLVLCTAAPAAALSLMSWNVQNLFDDVRDGTEYREFNPGRGSWNTAAFLQRIRSLSEALRKVVPGGPDVLLLQEVENENALKQFLDRGARGMGYSWHTLAPKRGLAATVAIVSRLPIARVRIHAVKPWKASEPVRDILEAQVEVNGHTLYVLNNHWKAKTEGVKATEASRKEAAAVLSARIREILAAEPAADIVAGGDFNENVDEYARTGRRYATALMPAGETAAGSEALVCLSPSPPVEGSSDPRCILYEPWFEIDAASRGSSSWQKEWLTADHILLSAGLFDRAGWHYRRGSFSAARLPFLLDERGFPRRWTARGSTQGISDHLPVVLTLDSE